MSAPFHIGAAAIRRTIQEFPKKPSSWIVSTSGAPRLSKAHPNWAGIVMRWFTSTSGVGRRWSLVAAFLLFATRGSAQPAPTPPAPARAAPYAILFGSLRTTGTPALIMAVAKDGDLLTVPVTYAITGVLRGAMRGPLNLLLRSPIIPAGTPAFAIPST